MLADTYSMLFRDFYCISGSEVKSLRGSIIKLVVIIELARNFSAVFSFKKSADLSKLKRAKVKGRFS